MNIDRLIRWWRGGGDRVPLPGRLTDLAAVSARYNRALISRSTLGTGAGNVFFPADSTRVALSVYALVPVSVGALDATVILRNASNTTVWSHTLVSKAADVALATPSPFGYWPLTLDILTHGPLVMSQIQLSTSSAVIMTLVELLLNPSLDLAPVGEGNP